MVYSSPLPSPRIDSKIKVLLLLIEKTILENEKKGTILAGHTFSGFILFFSGGD